MFAAVLKAASTAASRSAASRKAWLSRARAVTHGGKGVGWAADDGKPLTDIEQENIKSAVIPPGWFDVHVSSDKDPRLLAIGFDAKGRGQSKYSIEHSSDSEKAKFARVAKLTRHMPKLFRNSAADMMNPELSQKQRDQAATVYLVAKTGFRPGSEKDTGAESQAFGATTLEKRHISVNGDRVSFNFGAKSGKTAIKKIKDQKLAEYLSGKLSSLGSKDKVFTTTAASALSYVKSIAGAEYKVKDLRTWNGTALAASLVRRESPPTTEAAMKDLKKRVSTLVSAHLGNTPAVALKSYIDPAVWVSTEGMTKITKG